jgi:outer membrane protein assembly factor BamE (lipoprotein component of BamABCDE complex)
MFPPRFLVMLSLATVLVCACIPVPIKKQEEAFDREWRQFIVGTTTKEEVLSLLGEPNATYASETEFVYSERQLVGAFIVPGGVGGTVNDQVFLVLTFDAAGVLTSRDLQVAKGLFEKKCTAAGWCHGPGEQVMRLAETTEDARAKEFPTSPDFCGLYLYGVLGGPSVMRLDGESVGNATQQDIYFHWQLTPGMHELAVEAAAETLNFLCPSGGLKFVRINTGWTKLNLSQEDETEGRRDIEARRLAVPGSRAKSSMPWERLMNPTAGEAAKGIHSPPSDKAFVFIVKQDNYRCLVTIDGFFLSPIKKPNHFILVQTEPGSHMLVFAHWAGGPHSIITLDTEPGKSYFLAMNAPSSQPRRRGPWELLDSSSGYELVGNAQLEPESGPYWDSRQVMPRVVDPSLKAPGGAVVGYSFTIGRGVNLGEGARIGTNVEIGDNVTIGAGVVIGDEATIRAGATICASAVLGNRAVIDVDATVQTGEKVPRGQLVVAGAETVSCMPMESNPAHPP